MLACDGTVVIHFQKCRFGVPIVPLFRYRPQGRMPIPAVVPRRGKLNDIPVNLYYVAAVAGYNSRMDEEKLS